MAVIDLLPVDVRDEKRIAERVRLAGLVSVGVFAICLVFGVVQQVNLRSERASLASAQQVLESVQTQVNELNWIAEIQTDIQTRRTALSNALVADMAWPRILAGVTEAVTGKGELTGFTSTTGAVAGAAPVTLTLTGRTSDFPGLATLLDSVEGIEIIDSTYPTTGARSEEGTGLDVTYTLTAAVGEGAKSGRCTVEGVSCP